MSFVQSGAVFLLLGKALSRDRHVTVTESHATDKEDKEKDIDKELYISIVDYLNQKAGTNYRPTTKKTQSCINARLEEGFTLDDFKMVIDKKAAEWIGTEYEQFLRPETLFGTKFESYLNAKINPTRKKGNSGGNNASYDIKAYEARTIDDWESKEQPETAADNEQIRARAEELKKRFAEV